jgi:hypothetical protein
LVTPTAETEAEPVKNSLRWKDIAVILLVAAFVWVPLISTHWPEVYQYWYGNAFSGNYQEKSTFLSILLNALMLVVLGFQAVIFQKQAGISNRQRELMEGQLEAAKNAANAAQTAANAALAALDRPWLSVEVLTHNFATWERGGKALTVDFKIRNYGKAPAFLKSIKVALFLSDPADNAQDSESIKSQIEIVRFPAESELDNFITARSKAPSRDMNAPRREKSLAGGIVLPIFPATVGFDVPIILPSDIATETYFATMEPLHRTSNDVVLPIEALAALYLVGRIVYDGPTSTESEMITFCYRALRFGTFESHKVGPYNERRKANA